MTLLFICPFISHSYGSACKEHIVQTDPVTMTASVNLDPYNRKLGSDYSLWSCDKEVYMVRSDQGSKFFENIPEGSYLFKYNGEECSVDVKLNLHIVVEEEQATIQLPCEGEYFAPVILDVTANDYYTTDYAIRTIPIAETVDVVAVELVEAPSFVSLSEGRIVVDCPSDTAEGEYAFTYRLVDNQARVSNVCTVTLSMTRYCPEPPEPVVLSKPLTLPVAEYFTPNGDGIHDRWEMTALDTMGRFRTELYDRTGKMIWRATDLSDSWDGTCNGHAMPSGDYWFIIYLFDEDTTFRGHISLIR